MILNIAIKEFLFHCRFEKKLSQKTLKAYDTDLRQLNIFLNDIESITAISKNDIRNYLASISSLKPKSIKRKVATIKSLFNYLEYEDKITTNVFRKMKIKIREPQVLRAVMDLKEIVKIFRASYCKTEEISDKKSYAYFESLRNVVILELLFTTGARVSEIADLRKECINLHSGNIIILGKGNKERILQICNRETLSILQKYYSLYGKKITKAGGWFLINRFNKKLSDQSIRNMVSKISVSAGIPRHVTPHMFRHTFATLLLEKDVNIKYIQSLLGHSSIMTTQIYTHVNRKRQRQILTTKHPRKDFSMSFI